MPSLTLDPGTNPFWVAVQDGLNPPRSRVEENAGLSDGLAMDHQLFANTITRISQVIIEYDADFRRVWHDKQVINPGFFSPDVHLRPVLPKNYHE